MVDYARLLSYLNRMIYWIMLLSVGGRVSSPGKHSLPHTVWCFAVLSATRKGELNVRSSLHAEWSNIQSNEWLSLCTDPPERLPGNLHPLSFFPEDHKRIFQCIFFSLLSSLLFNVFICSSGEERSFFDQMDAEMINLHSHACPRLPSGPFDSAAFSLVNQANAQERSSYIVSRTFSGSP